MSACRVIGSAWILAGIVGLGRCAHYIMDGTNKPYLDLWLWTGFDSNIDPYLAAAVFLLAICAGLAMFWQQPWATRVLLTLSLPLLLLCLAHLRLLTHLRDLRENPDPGLTARLCALGVLCLVTAGSILFRRPNEKPG